MAELKSGIYCIENKINHKKYIGKGKNAIARMKKIHYKCLALLGAIAKYGDENFDRYIIEYCEPEKLVEREQYYIKEWNTKAPNGYNLTDGGEGVLNPTKETRNKISRANSGENGYWYGIKGEGHPTFGRKASDEEKEKNRLFHTNRPQSEETKKKRSESLIGYRHTDETRAKMRIAQGGENNPMYMRRGKDNPKFGIPLPQEIKDKISKTLTGKHLSQETIEKLRIANTGKHHTKESREKMSVLAMGENNHGFAKKSNKASSIYYGVYLDRFNDRWKIGFSENGKLKNIGSSKSEEDAARMYDKYVVEHNLNRPLNFPEDYPDYPIFVKKAKK